MDFLENSSYELLIDQEIRKISRNKENTKEKETRKINKSRNNEKIKN